MYFPYEDEKQDIFHGLVCFISGYECAKGLGSLVPRDFHNYVGAHYGVKHIGGMGWSSFISDNTGSELEAFDTFFSLIDKYVREKT